MSSYALGIIAALAGPFTMTLGFVIWDTHWAGSAFALNLFKCNLASVAFVILSVATRLGNGQQPFSPQVFQYSNVGYLMLSSAIGILIGDVAWLEGLRLLGVRNIVVMDSLKPFLAAVFGWDMLGEQLQWAAFGGIACTVVGILLVSLQQYAATPTTNNSDEEEQRLADVDDTQAQLQVQSTNDAAATTASYSKIEDVEISTRTDRTTYLAESSTLSLGTGCFLPYSSTNDVEVTFSSSSLPPTPLETDPPRPSETIENAPQYNDRDPSPSAVPETTVAIDHTNSAKRAKTTLDFYYGYGMAILNVILDTYGSVLTKQHGTEFTTWEINLIRFGFAGIVMLVLSLTLQLKDRMWHKPDHPVTEAEPPTTSITTTTTVSWYKLPPPETMSRNAWLHVSTGVLFVTFFTPALSNYALFQIALALALTLGSVGPLYALPLTYLLQKDQKRPTLQACFGALLTVVGIVILAFWGTLE